METDLVLVATAENAPHEEFVAWAKSCFQDFKTNRPSIGRIVIIFYLEL